MRANNSIAGLALAAAILLPAGWTPARADGFHPVGHRHHHGGHHHGDWGRHGWYGPRVYAPPPAIWFALPPVVIRPAPPPPVVVYAPPPPGFVYAPPPAGFVYAPPPPGFVYAPPPPAVTDEPAGPVYRAPNGQYCREYQTTVRVAGASRPGYGTACLQPDGTWRIVN